MTVVLHSTGHFREFEVKRSMYHRITGMDVWKTHCGRLPSRLESGPSYRQRQSLHGTPLFPPLHPSRHDEHEELGRGVDLVSIFQCMNSEPNTHLHTTFSASMDESLSSALQSTYPSPTHRCLISENIIHKAEETHIQASQINRRLRTDTAPSSQTNPDCGKAKGVWPSEKGH